MKNPSLDSPGHRATSSSGMPRRSFLIGAGAAGMALGAAMGRAYTQVAATADYALRIAPLRLELAPGKVIETFGYNGMVPGPVLRLREGRQVSIDIRNDTDVDDIIHWHGLYVPAAADGAMEEGSPMVERGGTQRYTFTAKPAGTRWYHSHNMAGTDLTRSLYSGMYGFLIVEPASDPGRYDQEVLLATHHWQGSWVSMQDIRTGPPPDNGLEVMYASASFNDKMLGHGEPIRVREGQRVLFRLLNASPTENVTLALPGHRLTVIALDGNPVPSQRAVDTLFLAPAERADVIVEMNRPGVWILGGIKDDDRKWVLASSSNTPTGAASRNGRRRPVPRGITRSLARTGHCLRRINGSISCSRKLPAVAAATTAGRSTANRGQIRIRCSPPSAESAIASP
jgi:FtsP/CotA-like multicopper oxidase with cupredoxin domain